MNRQIRISELSTLAGVPTSTIHYYVKEGLLPKPMKSGKTMAYYGDEHLERLQLIVRLREENNSIERIKEILHPAQTNCQDNPAGKTTKQRRADIIESAIHLFREKGFNDTSITDIIQHARAGRGTFYAYFTNKKELFLECADQIFNELDKDMREIREAADIPQKQSLRYMYFKSIYPRVSDMINLIRGASVSGQEVFTKKLDQLMKNLIDPIVDDVTMGINTGFYRDMDPELVAWMLMGATEYGSYLFYQTDPSQRDELYAAGLDLLINGLEQERP